MRGIAAVAVSDKISKHCGCGRFIRCMMPDGLHACWCSAGGPDKSLVLQQLLANHST
jgi:hypothetical protein